MTDKEKAAVELEEDYIVLAVPTDSVELTISAKIYHDGRLMDVSCVMGMKEIQAMFREARDNYIPEDTVFSLTEKGKAYLEELKRRREQEAAEAAEAASC